MSRELAVGDKAVASVMFEEFLTMLQKTGANVDLSLISKVEITAFKSDAASVCRASIISAEVLQPVRFAGNLVGVVTGRVQYFPSAVIILVLTLSLIFIALSIRNWTSNLIKTVELLAIKPIKELSNGKTIEQLEELPLEVAEISRNFDALKLRLKQEEQNAALIVKQKDLSDMAVQVAHDIRSPLSVLRLLENADFRLNGESHALMATAARRIQNICQSLTDRFRLEINSLKNESDSPSLAIAVIDAIVAEKNVADQNLSASLSVKLETGTEACFIPISSIEFGRIISNLIDNALESIGTTSSLNRYVKISLKQVSTYLEIVVSDNGSGIEKPMLERLGGKRAHYEETWNRPRTFLCETTVREDIGFAKN